MKQVVSISLGSSNNEYDIDVDFYGQKFNIKHFGTDGDFSKAERLLKEWDQKADSIGLGGVRFPNSIGPKGYIATKTKKFLDLASKIKTPTTTGETLRSVTFEWALRHIQFVQGNYFNNSRMLFFDGLLQYKLAMIMGEYTDNLTFADPVIKDGIPKFINSLDDLKLYADKVHSVLKYIPGRRFATSTQALASWNKYILNMAMQKAHTILVPSHDFYEQLGNATIEELGGKTVITSTVYDDRVEFLKDRGVDVIIDVTPKPFKQVVGVNVLEAVFLAALGKSTKEMTADDLMEILCEENMAPRIIYPSGEVKRKNRFSFVIHPLSQDNFKNVKAIKLLFEMTPPIVDDTVEKIMFYSPPFVYSKVTGIKSPAGVEAEGWLITVGGTPKQMLAHSPEFTYRRLLLAARMSKRMGAQIMGLGAFTKVVGDAGVTVSRKSELPITTGNSYSASGALWAASEAIKRMGLIDPPKSGERINAKAMVIGATGAIGSVCCRLLAKVFKEIYLIDIRQARLLSLRESILKEDPDVKIIVSSRADKYVGDMDVLVTATSSAGKKILDIMKVRPGCVITDVARPLDLSAEDVAKRPDVLVIESGEILLPGDNIKMKSIGLPDGVVFACMAETIVLALEGRFEIFTVGREIEWEKVKEIYQLGLKHGMRLAAISGVNGVFTDEDIDKVTALAIEARKKLEGKKEVKEVKDKKVKEIKDTKEVKDDKVKDKATNT